MTATCVHHPTVAAAGTCGGCGYAYCQGCLVPLLEQPYCGACRAARLAQLQNQEQRVFSRSRRWRGAFLSALGSFALLGVPLGVTLLLMQSLHLPSGSPVTGAVVIAGIAVSIGSVIFGSQRLALLGNEALRRDLAAKLASLGVPRELLSGLFVGVAVGLDRMQYDGDTDWDVGFLKVEPGRFLYFGDQAWFGLRPDQIQWMDLYPPKPSGPFVEIRLRIGWGDGWTQQAGVLTLAVRDFKTRKQSFERLRDLLSELEAWRARPAAVVDYWLPPPPVYVSGGVAAPATATEPGAFWRQLVIGIPLAIVMGVGVAVLRMVAGIDIPMWVGIMLAIGLSQLLAQGWESYLKSRR